MEGDGKSEINLLEEGLPSILLKTEENDDFVFETDSYALQNNKDYQVLLKTLVKLQSQRIYTVKALEELQQAREAALKDPFDFVEALQNGEAQFHSRIKVAQVPDIDMSKYDISSYIEAIRPNTRRSTKESFIASILSDNKKASSETGDSNSKTSKPRSATHNVYWTADEQRKLEELLIKYPDEPIAAKRYAKIAKELGSRTLMQVQSRVQKYFISLKKEGLPVPGRDPKSSGLRHLPRKRSYVSQTGASAKFMKAFDFEDSLPRRKGTEILELPVEAEVHPIDTDIFASCLRDEEGEIKTEEKEDAKVKRFIALQKIKKLKLKEVKTGDIVHLGVKCAGCLCDPIRGTRWHCDSCPYSGLDLCNRCSKYFVTEKHTKKHDLRPLNSLNAKDTLRYLMNKK